VTFIPHYCMRLHPCLVMDVDWFSKIILFPHLHLTCILVVPVSSWCAEPSNTTILAGEDTVFCLIYILKGRLHSEHLRVRRCPFWLSVFPKQKHTLFRLLYVFASGFVLRSVTPRGM
jgi:hypothetical protein